MFMPFCQYSLSRVFHEKPTLPCLMCPLGNVLYFVSLSGARASPRYDRGQGTPTRYRDRARDDEFFGLQGRGGSALNEEEKKMIEQDFDFEANLAMFDKDREMREIEADLMSNKPDIVR